MRRRSGSSTSAGRPARRCTSRDLEPASTWKRACSMRRGSRSSTWTTPATGVPAAPPAFRSRCHGPRSDLRDRRRRAAIHEELRERGKRLSDPILDAVERYYSGRFAEHGATARGVDWNSRSRRSCASSSCSRSAAADGEFSLNDYGCGYGALISALESCGVDFAYQRFRRVGDDA